MEFYATETGQVFILLLKYNVSKETEKISVSVHFPVSLSVVILQLPLTKVIEFWAIETDQMLISCFMELMKLFLPQF